MYNILNFTIMFFQAINQMITAGTDLSINIRRVNSNLTVAVVPRRSGVKDGERIVPLILNGTPEELDAGFLQAVGTPVQKAQGILTNLETFEKQAEQAVSQSKAARSAAEKESKEVREKREKMEKLLKKAEDAMTGKRYSEALTWLKQAKVLALPDKQKEIDEKMAEVQKKASEGSLFGMEQPPMSKPQPAPQQPASQPAAAPAPQYRSGEQIPMFLPEQPAPVPQPVSQPQPPRSVVHPGQQTPFTRQPQTQPVQYTRPHHKRNRSRNRQFHNRKESSSINRYRCHRHGWTEINGCNRLRHNHGMHRYRRPQELMRSNISGNRKRLRCTTSTRTARTTGKCSGKTRMRNIQTFRRNAA